MQKRPMIKHSKRITDDDDVYTRRYTAPLKGGGTPSFLFGVETSVKIRRYNMACFLVPATEAIITTVVAKVIKSKEKEESVKFTLPDGSVQEATRIKFSTKLGWLNKLLWGGSALLAFEHLWHGEVVPFFPFLTAVENGETADMLAEMGSAGVMMAVLVTAVWCGMLAVSSFMEKRAIRDCKLVKEGM